MTQSPKQRWPTILAFVIAIAGFAAFIYLNRKMAPPFPKKTGTNASASTNANAKTGP
jgi:hypothetical protein